MDIGHAINRLTRKLGYTWQVTAKEDDQGLYIEARIRKNLQYLFDSESKTIPASVPTHQGWRVVVKKHDDP